MSVNERLFPRTTMIVRLTFILFISLSSEAFAQSGSAGDRYWDKVFEDKSLDGSISCVVAYSDTEVYLAGGFQQRPCSRVSRVSEVRQARIRARAADLAKGDAQDRRSGAGRH